MRVLVGCFRTGDANDPAIYADAVMACLSDYPIDVVRRVVDPRNGLPSRYKWLPTIAEVKEACEEEMAPLRRAKEDAAREQRTLAQIAQREAHEHELARQRATGEHERVSAKFDAFRRDMHERHGQLRESDEMKFRRTEILEAANKSVFRRECEAAGIDPAGGVSPSLRKILTARQPMQEAAE